MKPLAIVIPIYKQVLTGTEEISFRQTLRVLGKHPIIMVCPESLNIAAYNIIATDYNISLQIESFKDEYFKNIAGYNRLLLSMVFYQRFATYQYILIAQLDAYVFSDSILQWCAKGYDYIGSPLFGAQMNINRATVGNGGLSLRRVEAYINYFNGDKHVIPCKKIASRINVSAKPYTRWLVWLLMIIGWRNTPCQCAKHYKYNEDLFWSQYLNGTNYELNKPSVIEAAEFAWERFPSELYAQLGHLPFGCHAWEKNEYELFWRNYIK